MTRKLIALILSFAMLFALASCGSTVINSIDNSPVYENQSNRTEQPSVTSFEPLSSFHITEFDKVTETVSSESETYVVDEPTKVNTHTHSYLNATCTSPKKCSCGATAGTALGHQFSSATCTSPRTCNRCGMVEGSALGHNYVSNKCVRCGKIDPNSLPVGLEELHVIDSYQYDYKSGSFKDSYGYTYNGVHYFTRLYESSNDREPHAQFNLDSNYKTFSGSIVATTKTTPDFTYYINIYVDGVLKYSEKGFSRTSKKVDFEIDVNNASAVKITAGIEGNTGDSNQEIGIVNAVLTK